ncbi:MAG: T9SS type A sorting domain-containing protein [Saprospiraceae bacterium]|nr:T9SS type A sorting domain-containing protein [Saprospiraceae bacterium]
MFRHIHPLLWVLLGAYAHAQTTHYVNPQATGANNGASWADAYTDLHPALAAAQSGDAVWVKEGTYRPSAGNDRQAAFVLKSGVGLYGGFRGDEQSLAQRDWSGHPTVLDGDIGAPGDSTDNSYTLLYLPYPDGNTIIDGFVFQKAVANNTATNEINPTTCGAALYIDGTDSMAYPLIVNCAFRGNTARLHGGAVYAAAGAAGSIAPRFRNCRFEYNRAAGGSGGAVYRAGSSWVEWAGDFSGCVFERNYAWANGGGVCYEDAAGRTDTLQLDSCVFRGNYARLIGGGFQTMGRSTGGNLTANQVEFIENDARVGGGFAYESDDGVIEFMQFRNCNFWNNNAHNDSPGTAEGPSLSIFSFSSKIDGTLRVENCRFLKQQNKSNNIILVLLSNLEVVGCVFSDSISLSLSTGGDIYFIENICGPNAGWFTFQSWQKERRIFISGNVFINNNRPNLIHGTPAIISGNAFINNRFHNSLNPPFNPNIPSLVFNNIFYNNVNTNPMTPGKNIPLRNDSAYFYNNLIYDAPNCGGLHPQYICGANNLFRANPMFVDTAALDLRLQPCSPAVNAGVNDFYQQAGITTDLYGAARISDGQADIGPAESPSLWAQAPKSVRAACAGAATGGVAFHLDNGCNPYAFAWAGSAGAGTDTTGLAVGDYSFTVTDQRGKVWVESVTIGESPAIGLQETITPAACMDCPTGSISVSATSGAGPFYWLWSTGDTTSGVGGLLSGDYGLTVTDGAGCTRAFSYTVSIGVGSTNQQAEDALGMTVSPNPARHTARVLMSRAEYVTQMSLSDAAGREVWRWNEPAARRSSVDLPLEGLAPGVYVVRVATRSGVLVEKLVVE